MGMALELGNSEELNRKSLDCLERQLVRILTLKGSLIKAQMEVRNPTEKTPVISENTTYVQS